MDEEALNDYDSEWSEDSSLASDDSLRDFIVDDGQSESESALPLPPPPKKRRLF